MSSIIFQVQSTLIVLILYYGIYRRKDRVAHPKIMTFAIVWDLLLVLQIELTRGAIDRASKVVTNTALLNFHVSIAVSTVILYFILFYLGRKMVRGDLSQKKLHVGLGILCIILRTSTYITSYMIETKP
jgi:FlaA1/EpsC-like NDP-sugar epimerase